MSPLRRRDALIVSQLQDETIVYDLERHRAHCLNPTAALVWRYCDGETSVSEMTRRLGAHLGKDLSDDWIWRALSQLRKANLLEESEEPREGQRVSRRELLRVSGMAAAALLPVVVSLVAPTAAIAGFTCNRPCIASNGCRPGGLDLCKCCGPPSCSKKCDAAGICANGVGGC